MKGGKRSYAPYNNILVFTKVYSVDVQWLVDLVVGAKFRFLSNCDDHIGSGVMMHWCRELSQFSPNSAMYSKYDSNFSLKAKIGIDTHLPASDNKDGLHYLQEQPPQYHEIFNSKTSVYTRKNLTLKFPSMSITFGKRKEVKGNFVKSDKPRQDINLPTISEFHPKRAPPAYKLVADGKKNFKSLHMESSEVIFNKNVKQSANTQNKCNVSIFKKPNKEQLFFDNLSGKLDDVSKDNNQRSVELWLATSPVELGNNEPEHTPRSDHIYETLKGPSSSGSREMLPSALNTSNCYQTVSVPVPVGAGPTIGGAETTTPAHRQPQPPSTPATTADQRKHPPEPSPAPPILVRACQTPSKVHTMTATSTATHVTMQKPSASPLLKSNVSPMLKPSGSPLLKSSVSPMPKSNGSPMLTLSASPMLKTRASPMFKSSASPMPKTSGDNVVCEETSRVNNSRATSNTETNAKSEREDKKSAKPQNPNVGQTIQRNQTGTITARNYQHHHLSVEELGLMQRRQDSNGSSSDDGTRSSGHASMSDGHLSSSPCTDAHPHYRTHLNSVPEDERLSASVMQNQSRAARKPGHNRSRHRATPAKLVPSGSGLEDIKLAIEQLTMRSHTTASYSSSTYSSMSGSESSEPAVRRLIRHSSLETINTNITSADEFVWVDSHNRLVELQHLPWSNHDVLKVVQNGRLKEHMERVSMETIPRLSYLLQRALVRLAREAQRLAKTIGLCSKQEVSTALKITLCPALADSCTKACLRSAAMFAVSGDLQLKQSKSARAGLQLSVGRFQRWMADVRLGKYVHEYAAVYMTAGLENLLEEIIIQCLPNEPDTILTATMFEHAIANNGDLWGLLQPYAHLNAGRIASGALAMPRWASVSSVNTDATHTASLASSKSLEQSLLTTCVGSVHELSELLARVSTRLLSWTPPAIQALFYFMRCSQLEHSEHYAPIQELVYERAYIVLPPLVEWLRVTAAHAEHRHAAAFDSDDVMQAARLLLPGIDCPVRQPRCGGDESLTLSKRPGDEVDCVRKLKTELAFKMLSNGRTELVPHALQLLPTSKKLNSVNESGMTALMLAVVEHNEMAVRCLLDAGADPDVETPPAGSAACPNVNAEVQHWTAITYAALQGVCNIALLLLDRGAHIEGGARLSEDKCTQTPLQVAAASGHTEMVALLLSHGAHTFLSTLLKDSLCYSGAAQRGAYSAISVATAHGQRSILHMLLAQPLTSNNKEVLSLEEILAEGANHLTADRRGTRIQAGNSLGLPNLDKASSSLTQKGGGENCKLSKSQVKSLQEAMYHSTESNNLDMTLDLRNMGIPWTLHCWMHTLATAQDQRLDNVIDQLLQDFLQVWPDDYSTQFVDECLPLLCNIFRLSKNEGTTLLLADIFSTCYGWESIKAVRETSFSSGTRIDPKFVNNPELSDVQFRVEGRLFYGHKIVLVTWSPRFRAMLSSKLCDGSPPIVHINDIRYHIFQLVMQYLYNGGCETLRVEPADVLELMAASNFFQLDGLLRFCEAQCSAMINLDNIVSMYIHAKVYNASELLDYCQGFLLQNMVALLTYDDSVKRLLFGKKLHSHDVLAGLLSTLQARIKARNLAACPRSTKPK